MTNSNQPSSKGQGKIKKYHSWKNISKALRGILISEWANDEKYVQELLDKLYERLDK